MKKTLAIVLALVMVFALAACGGTEEPSVTPSAGASVTPSASESSSVQPSESSSTEPTTSAEPAPTTSAEPSPASPSNSNVAPTGGAGTVGYVTDDVDHNARNSYHIVYYNYTPTVLTQQTTDALNQLGAAYNFTVEQLTANGDADAYVNNLQTILLKGPDGLIIDIQADMATRVSQILDENDVPAVCLFNKATSPEGSELIPAVIMDQYYNGQRQVEYLESVYKDHFGDIDPSKIALLIMDYSVNVDIATRGDGARAKFEELFPGNTIYYGDTAADGLNADAGFKVSNSIMSVHPEVEYWFVVGTVEDITLGTGRAVESLNLTDKVIMTASGAAILPGEWDAGTASPCWLANYAISPFYYSGTGIFGLIALMDGRATKDTLWPDQFLEGDQAARYSLKADMMTQENYKTYLGDVVRSFGVEYEG